MWTNFHLLFFFLKILNILTVLMYTWGGWTIVLIVAKVTIVLESLEINLIKHELKYIKLLNKAEYY